MKVYTVSGLDGLTEAMVAAGTIAEAAAALGTSIPAMRKVGWQRLKGPAAAIALKEPGTPFYRPITGAKPGKWTSDRSAALAAAARRAMQLP